MNKNKTSKMVKLLILYCSISFFPKRFRFKTSFRRMSHLLSFWVIEIIKYIVIFLFFLLLVKINVNLLVHLVSPKEIIIVNVQRISPISVFRCHDIVEFLNFFKQLRCFLQLFFFGCCSFFSFFKLFKIIQCFVDF